MTVMRMAARCHTLSIVTLVVAAGGCATIQPHIDLPVLRTGTPAFVRTLEAYAGAALLDGQVVEILLNGNEIFPAQLAAIASATRTITVRPVLLRRRAGGPA